MAVLYLNDYNTEARIDNRGLEVIKKSVTENKKWTMRVPLWDLDHVVVVGRPYVTTNVFTKLAWEGIPVMFVTTSGRWLGGLYPNKNGHALRRIRQYQLHNNSSFSLTIAKRLVGTKIRNSRRVLQRLSSNRSESHLQEQMVISNRLNHLVDQCQQSENLDQLRGYEGVATAVYFKRLGDFFPEDIPFISRSRRPPKDEANAILSFSYTVLLGEIDAAVRCSGLDPCIGYLHEISYGRPSLSLDLLEPFRAPVCDLLVLQILNHRILKKEDFEINKSDGGTYMRKEARKEFFIEYERAMNRYFTAIKGGAHTNFRQLIQEAVRAVLAAQESRDDLPFFEMP
jgi:CRISPR-associated protein Cas1